MSVRKAVTMDAAGRLTVPAEARHQLHLEGETEFTVEVVDGVLTLRPAVTITVSREDAWAFTASHRKKLRRALEQVEAGQVVSGAEVHLGRSE